MERRHQVFREALEIYMDERIAAEPTLVRDRQLLLEGLTHVPHQINRLAFTKGFSPCQWVLGMDPSSRLGNSADKLSPCHLGCHDHGHYLRRPHGAANGSHDCICPGRLVVAIAQGIVAQAHRHEG